MTLFCLIDRAAFPNAVPNVILKNQQKTVSISILLTIENDDEHTRDGCGTGSFATSRIRIDRKAPDQNLSDV